MPHFFKTRIFLSLATCMIVSAIAGGAFVLERVHAQNSAPLTTYDAVQDGRIDNLADRQKTDDTDRAQLNKRIEDIEKTEAEIHGALWLGGALVAFLTAINTILTVRTGIRKFEHDIAARRNGVSE